MNETADRDDLLVAASEVLAGADFNVLIEPLAGSEHRWLLAENDYFAIAALADPSWEELAKSESIASERLLERLGGLEGGAKRWDAYLVLLTTERWSGVDDRERSDFLNNTRGVRRLVGAQLVPDPESGLERPVAEVLRPFLPLGDALGSGLADLDQALVDVLVLNGVDADEAPRYVSAYRNRGDLDDV